MLIYGVLFGIGKMHPEGVPHWASLFIGMALAAGAVIYWDLSRRGWTSVME